MRLLPELQSKDHHLGSHHQTLQPSIPQNLIEKIAQRDAPVLPFLQAMAGNKRHDNIHQDDWIV